MLSTFLFAVTTQVNVDTVSATLAPPLREFSFCLFIGYLLCEHITPALRQLHWLPVHRWVDFKISTLVYRSLAGTTPVYLAYECTTAGRRPLRSADNRTCLVKRSCNQFSDCCFATARPMPWNNLPEQLRQPDINFGLFKQLLNTFMFG